MTFKRILKYHWLKFLRLQDHPRKLAGGMALGIFIGITPTVPFHTVTVLFLAPLLKISPVTAVLGLMIINPLILPALYLAAYKVGQFLLYQGHPLLIPESCGYREWLAILWQGGVALQVGGIIIAIPPAIVSYFLSLWIVRRYRQRKARKAAGVLPLPQNSPTPSGPDA